MMKISNRSVLPKRKAANTNTSDNEPLKRTVTISPLMDIYNRDFLFRVKLENGFKLKQIVDLMKCCRFNEILFDISPTGLRFHDVDNGMSSVLDFNLEPGAFELFELTDSFVFKVELVNLNDCIKSLKKKDSIELFKTSNTPNMLGLVITNDDHSLRLYVKTTRANKMVMEMANITIPPMLEITSSQLLKRAQTLRSLGQSMTLVQYEHQFRFFIGTCGIYGAFIDILSDVESTGELRRHADFSTQRLRNIIKFAQLHPNFHIGINDIFLVTSIELPNVTLRMYLKNSTRIQHDEQARNVLQKQ